MITFRKILKYDLVGVGDTYEYLAGVTAQTIDPPSLQPGEMHESGTVLVSPLRRARECISEQGIVTSELREVPFDLKTVCTKEAWEKEGSVAVRRGFKQAFVDDTLLVRREELLREIQDLVSMLRGMELTNNTVVVVSHSFRMKLIEAYIGTKGALANNPGLLHQYIDDSTKTYEFGEGFTTTLQGQDF